MYQRQQNILYPKGGNVFENNILQLLIGSYPLIDGRSLFVVSEGLTQHKSI